MTTTMKTTVESQTLSAEDAAIATRLGCCVSETNMSNDSIIKKMKRYELLKNMGVASARVQMAWTQSDEDSWGISSTTEVALVAEAGLRVKLITATIMQPPSWIFEKYGDDARMYTQDGERSGNNCLSYWSPNLTQYTQAAVEHIFADLVESGLLGSVDAVVVDLGAAGEPLYPPAWTQPGLDTEKMWCYGDNAQADFCTKMEKKYGSISAANKAWGTTYANFSAVSVPKPDGSAAGKMWEDVLTWYRDVKRAFIQAQIEAYKTAVQKYAAGRIKLILYVPGSDVSQEDWNNAVKTGTATGNVAIMCDNAFIIDMAKEHGCWLQYTGCTDVNQCKWIRSYMDSIGIANTPIFGENAGDAINASMLDLIVDNIVTYEFFGIDYTHTVFLFEDDRVTPNSLYSQFVRAMANLKTYIEAKQR